MRVCAIILPPELTDLIIDFVSPSTASLKACALTCRSFCTRASYHLFHSLVFRGTAFERFLHAATPIPRVVTLSNFYRATDDHHQRNLNGVKELRMEHTGWLADLVLPVGMQRVSVTACHFYDYDALYAFIARLGPGLKAVKLGKVDISSRRPNTLSPAGLHTLAQIEELELGGSVCGFGLLTFAQSLVHSPALLPFSLDRLRILRIRDPNIDVFTLRQMILRTEQTLHVLTIDISNMADDGEPPLELGHLRELELHVSGVSSWWSTLLADLAGLQRLRITWNNRERADTGLPTLFAVLKESTLPMSACVEIQGGETMVKGLCPQWFKNTTRIID